MTALVAVVLVLGSLGLSRPSSGLRPLGEIKSGDVVTVELGMSGYRPKTIEAKVGTELKLRLITPETASHAEGGDEHQFAIDELDMNYIVKPRGELVVSFTPTTPGTYTFYCDVCCGGRDNPTMRGTLEVAA